MTTENKEFASNSRKRRFFHTRSILGKDTICKVAAWKRYSFTASCKTRTRKGMELARGVHSRAQPPPR